MRSSRKKLKRELFQIPNAPVDPETGMPLDQAAGMDLGAPVMEPDLDSTAKKVEAPELPKGGEI
jgi:hypothetical protein